MRRGAEPRGANALIVSGRVGAVDHYDLAMQIAAEIFPIRYVCGFGRHPPDGFVPFDDLYTADELDPIPALEPERAADPGPGAHLAVITWDVSADGLVPVGRSHAELIAGGLAALLEGRLAQEAVLLSTLTMSSFAGLAVGVVPWLLVGGTLALHQPFDPDAFLVQRQSSQCDTLIVPGPLVAQLADAGLSRGGRWPRQCDRRLACARAADPGAALAREHAHDRRARLRGNRPHRRLP